MTRAEKQIEVLKLLKLVQKEGEKPGDTILRALKHLVGYDTPAPSVSERENYD